MGKGQRNNNSKSFDKNRNIAKNNDSISESKFKSTKQNINRSNKTQVRPTISFKQHKVDNKLNSKNNKYQNIKYSNPHHQQQQNQAYDAVQNINVFKNQKTKKYEQLINQSTKGFKRQKNIYFLENQKYKAKNYQHNQQQDIQQNQQIQQSLQHQQIHEENQNDQEMINQQNQQDQDQDQQEEFQGQDQQFQQDQESQDEQKNNNQIHQALNLLKQKRSQTSKLLNQQISSINKQDHQSLSKLKKLRQKSTTQQYQQAIQLKKLLQVYDHLVSLRYNQQRQLQDIKMFPSVNIQQQKFPPNNHQLFVKNKQLQNQMITNLSKMFGLYKNFGKKCGLSKQNNQQDDQVKIQQEQTLQKLIQNDKNKQDSEQKQKINLDKIYEYVQQNLTPFNNEVQKQLIKWSQKTSFLTSNNSSQYNSLIMQTPIGQAKKVLSNWQRMTHKSQQKRGTAPFKILFQNQENIHQSSDSQIYDDYDLFIQLQKYYLQKLDNDEDGQFLQSATMKYLKNRQLNQLHKQGTKKQVDRKASKNRKIRYNAHIKLLNFMPSIPQNLIQTRDQIVRNIFNCNANINEQAIQGNKDKYNIRHNKDEQIDYIEVA